MLFQNEEKKWGVSYEKKFHAPDPLDYLDSICSNQNPLKHAQSPQTMLSCPNPDLLKRTHSPQGMLLLIDPIGYFVMKRKDGEFPHSEVKLYHQEAYQ